MLAPPRLLHLAAAFVAASLLLGPAGARAQDPGQDEVTLKNGGAIRGTVVAWEPGASVRIIELGQTEVRTIPWSQVSDVERGKFAPRPAAPPGPPTPVYAPAPLPFPAAPLPPPVAPLGTPGVVRLHIDVPHPTALFTVPAGFYGYGAAQAAPRRVCTAPCDAVVDGSAGRAFRLESDAYPAPDVFTFGSRTGDVTMTILPGSEGKRTAGVIGVVLGSLATVTGAVMFPAGQFTTVTDVTTQVTRSIPDRPIRNAGIGALAGGLVVLATGIGLMVTGRTRMTIEPRVHGAPQASGTTARPQGLRDAVP